MIVNQKSVQTENVDKKMEMFKNDKWKITKKQDECFHLHFAKHQPIQEANEKRKDFLTYLKQKALME